jgi:alkylation response protein AidB-like acyl-CoA dehydrogenase
VDSFDYLAQPHIMAVAHDAATRIERRVASGADSGEALLGGCIDDLRATGYLNLTIPSTLGGLGGNVLDACVAQERVSRALGSAGLAANMHVQYIGASLVSGLWQAPQLETFLREPCGTGA